MHNHSVKEVFVLVVLKDFFASGALSRSNYHGGLLFADIGVFRY